MIRLINRFADIYPMGKFVNEYSYVLKMETSIRICFKFFTEQTHTMDMMKLIYKLNL